MAPGFVSVVLSFRAAVAAILLAAAPGSAADAPRGRDLPRERAEWNLLFRQDAGGRVLPENRLRALRQACDLPVDPSMVPDRAGTFTRSDAGPSAIVPLAFGGTAWQSIGPSPINPLANAMYGWTSASGRIDALAVHPTNPSVMLLGSATGGIWKSTDAGTTWRPVSDTAPSLATSSIAFTPSNPSIVYAATGELDTAEYRPSTSLGMYLSAGLLRSLDGGESWTRVDTNLPANSVLSRVVVSASNPQVVLVGVFVIHDIAANSSSAGGVYRSTDGGVTFSRTFTHFVSDLVADPNDPSVFLLGAGVNGGCASCDEDGIWGSTDSGASWIKVLTGGQTLLGPTKLAVSRTNPAVYYASILDPAHKHAGAGGIYRSTDGANNWTRQSVEPTMCGNESNQCYYDHFIAVHPTNPGTVYFGSVNVYRSDDGAGSWNKLTPFYDQNFTATVHPDEHAGIVLPGSPDTFFLASDGGLFKTTNGGTSWTSLNATLTLAQFNSVSLHPSNASVALGGTQDNGSPFYTGNSIWDDRTAGDGGNPLIRQDDTREMFGPHYFASFAASTDGGATFKDRTPCNVLLDCQTGDPLETMSFYVPTAAAPTAGRSLFIGTNRIWVNATFGTSAGAWQPRSSSKITDEAFTAIDVAGDGNGVVWAGTRGGAILFSTDGGATFADRRSGLGPGIISSVRIASADGNTAYVTQGGFSGSPSRHVFRTTNGGQSWTNLSGNLPDAPILSIAMDPVDASDLFVGTDVGVFRSTNGGASWASFNQGLPNVPVHDIRFGPTSGTLTAATYGRGVYRITTQGSNRPPTASITSPASNVTISAGQSVTFAGTASDPDGDPMTYAWSFGDGGTSTALSPGAHPYADGGVFNVTFAATDSRGASSGVQTRTVTVQGGGPPGSAMAVKLVPIVLDVHGAGGSHYGTELTLANRGTTASNVSLLYTAASALNASGSGTVPMSLGAGKQVVIPDAIGYLRSHGLSIPADGSSQGGTLQVTFGGLSSTEVAYAGARTTTPSGTGRAGLSYPGVAPSECFTDKAWIYGLRQNVSDRSNLALVNANLTSSITLRVYLWNADASQAYYLTPDTTLGPGQWTQLSNVLSSVGFSSGFARIDRISGPGPFTAYGVFNDNVTNDGSFVPPMADTYQAEAQTVPVLVETGTFSSELVLANYTNQYATVSLSYTESLNGGGGGGVVVESLGPGEQRIIPDAIQYLRRKGMNLASKGSGSFAGALNATFYAGGAPDGGFAGARTGAPSGSGGQYGLFYPALGPSESATGEAWIFGLQENSSVRANLAVANLGDGGTLVFHVDVYNGDTGAYAGRSIPYTLESGRWIQFSGVLPTFDATNGYARVVKESGSGHFLSYGVINDGATPGSGATNDGSYIGFAH